MPVNAGVRFDLSPGTEAVIANRTQLPASPRLGEIYYVTGENKALLCTDATPGAVVWSELGAGAATTVHRSAVAGETPAALAANVVPADGDLFLNTTDRLAWVYGPDVALTGHEWVPLTPGAATVYVSATAGVVPDVSFGATVHPFPPGTVLKEGDEFINKADHAAWVYGPDPATPGNPLHWIKLPAATLPSVLVAPRRDVDPYLDPAATDPATGQPMAGLVAGSVYVNPWTTELYVVTPAGADLEWTQASVHPTRVATAAGTVLLVARNATDDPWTDPNATDQATGLPLAGLAEGGLYVNPTTTELYVLATVGGGLEWIQASRRPWQGQWRTGSGDPAPTLGVAGDHYLDITTNVVWRRGTTGWAQVGTSATDVLAGLTVDQLLLLQHAAVASSQVFVGRVTPVGHGTPGQGDVWLVTPAVLAGTAGTPGAWFPAGAAPATIGELTALGALAVPATAWATGEYAVLANGTTEVHWNGTAWVPGRA